MNLQIRIEIPKPADGKDYETPTEVQTITDPECIRAILETICNVERERAMAVAYHEVRPL